MLQGITSGAIRLNFFVHSRVLEGSPFHVAISSLSGMVLCNLTRHCNYLILLKHCYPRANVLRPAAALYMKLFQEGVNETSRDSIHREIKRARGI